MKCTYLLISLLLSSPDPVTTQALEISNLVMYCEKKVSNCEKLYLPAEIADLPIICSPTFSLPCHHALVLYVITAQQQTCHEMAT